MKRLYLAILIFIFSICVNSQTLIDEHNYYSGFCGSNPQTWNIIRWNKTDSLNMNSFMRHLLTKLENIENHNHNESDRLLCKNCKSDTINAVNKKTNKLDAICYLDKINDEIGRAHV